MDELLERLRTQVDLAAPPIDSNELRAAVARRDDARRRRTRVIRGALVASFVVLMAAIVSAVLVGSFRESEVATGPARGTESCGSYEVTQREIVDGTSAPRPAQQCILDAFATGDAALLEVRWPTIEGTPVATYYLVTARDEVAVITDGTDDTYSSMQVTTQSCTSLQLETRGPLLAASGCDEPVQCGAVDVATDWDAAGREPMVTRVRCLTDAFEAGRPATMSFSYTSDGTEFHWSFLIEDHEQVLVAARRKGPDVPPELRFTIERCTMLTTDSSGSPISPPRSCTPLHETSAPRLETSTLTVPAVGEARPDQLLNGKPVWVVRHDDGTVSVLDAVSSHRPFGMETIVGWCPSSRGFVDPAHGSQFDERGRNRGGPAPIPLGTYETGPVEDETVTVTDPDPAPSGLIQGDPSAGAECLDGETNLELHPLGQNPG